MGKMHQTTVRFGPDLWGDIEAEARRAGVSVAQYVRDSAMMRVAYTRGRDGDPHYDAALALVADDDPNREAADFSMGARREAAQRAESRQGRRRARAIRDQAEQQRGDAEADADA